MFLFGHAVSPDVLFKEVVQPYFLYFIFTVYMLFTKICNSLYFSFFINCMYWYIEDTEKQEGS